ncbi:hypothetical protein LSH36_336g03012 [Paralvinella palmiformis]|uniref:Globin domain-containing protein n=2 Tax=Paralvinella palmiformis TaxID=53620 RepID=A0AAD9N050_9ANNE|nr:hypothetical protein LSH36_336g03012 [Paralvinella palmiformis]
MAELTGAHVKAVRDSWDVICKDVRGNGVQLFLRYFGAFPEYLVLFKDLRGMSLEELKTSKHMRIHGSRVLHALTSMVDALDELDVAAGIMSKTIDTHFDFNVQNIKKYEDLFSVMPDFMKAQAGDKFTPLAQEGWTLVLNTLLAVGKERIAQIEKQKAAMA